MRLFLPAVLVLGLSLAPAAAAAKAAPRIDPLRSAEEFEYEYEEEESAAEECSEARQEAAAGEIDQEELEEYCEPVEEGGKAASRPACPLRSARAHASLRNDTIKVTLGYTAYQPFEAQIRLSPGIGTVDRHLSRTGTVRITHRLGRRSPGTVFVRLRDARAPGCPARRLVIHPR
jgi:hypothetical protein